MHSRLTTEIEKDPEKYSQWVIQQYDKKAEKNKRKARSTTFAMVAFSSISVMFIYWEGYDWHSLLASLFVVAQTLILGWAEFEKPYERWRLYRRYHRLADAERHRYLNKVSPYDGQNPVKLLAERTIALELAIHDEWEGILPKSKELERFGLVK